MEVNGKPTYLICTQNVAAVKEYNIWRHYEANHGEKYDEYPKKLHEDKVYELAQSLKKGAIGHYTCSSSK